MCVGETERAFFHMAITLKISEFLKKLLFLIFQKDLQVCQILTKSKMCDVCLKKKYLLIWYKMIFF